MNTDVEFKTFHLRITTISAPFRATTKTLLTLALLVTAFFANSVKAGTLTWDPNGNSTDGAGTWGVTTPASWWNGTSHSQNYLNTTPFTDAVFGWNSGTAGTVTMVNLSVNSFTFNPFSGTYTFDAASALTFTLKNNITMNSGAGVVIFNANAKIALGADSTWNNASTANALTVNSIVSGNFNLTKTGAGALTLSALNTFGSGKTFRLSAGTLNINHAKALGSTTTTFQIDDSTTIDNITGTALTIGNNNPITLNGNFTFTGGSGTTHDLNLGTGTVALGGATRTITANAGILTFGGIISNGGLTKSGAGTLTLSGANTYSGATTVNGGVLRLSNANALPGGIAATGGTNSLTIANGVVELANGNFLRNLGTGVTQVQITNGISGFSAYSAARIVNFNNDVHKITWGDTTFNPATLVLNEATANNTLDFQNVIDLGASLRTVTVNANTATLSGVLTNGSLAKIGTGALTLSGVNSFAGGLYIKSGMVNLGNISAAGNVTNTIYLGDADTDANVTLSITIDSTSMKTNPISVVAGNAGTATLNFAHANQTGYVRSLITLENHDLILANTTGSLYGRVEGGITGTGSLRFVNNALINVAAGTINTIGSVTFSHIGIQGTQIGSGGNGNINNTGAITNISTGTGSVTINNAIGPNVTAVVQNSTNSTMILSGTNTFSGGLYIKAGTVTAASGGPTNTLGVGTVTLGSGLADGVAATLVLNNGAINSPSLVVSSGSTGILSLSKTGVNANQFYGGSIALNNNLSIVNANSYDMTLSGLITEKDTDSPALTINTPFAGNNSSHNLYFTGGIVVGSGGLTIRNPDKTIINIGTVGISGTGKVTFENNGMPDSGSESFKISANINNAGAFINTGTGGGATTISGNIGSNVTGLTHNNANSTMTLSGTNTYTGSTTISAGTLTISGTSKLGGGDYPAAITNNGTLVYSSTATQTLNGVISGSGTLTQTAGSLFLNGINTGTGLTTVSAGTLGGNGTIAGLVNMASGFAALAPSLGLGGSNTLTLTSTAANALTLNGGPVLKFALSNTGTNDQIKIAGTLVLNGANYITLSFPQGSAPIGTYTLMAYGSKTGGGTLALNGSYPNAMLTVSDTSVILNVTGAATSGASNLTWKDNGNGNWNTSTLNWTNGITAVAYTEGNAVTFDDAATTKTVSGAAQPGSTTFNNTADYTISAAIGGTGYLLKNGSAKVFLSGINSYTGPTVISSGTLTISSAGQLGNGSYSGEIMNNGIFTYESSAAQTLSGSISGAGSLSDTGTLTLTGTNTYNGITTVYKSGSVLTVAGSGVISNVAALYVGATGSSSGLGTFYYYSSAVSSFGAIGVGNGAGCPGSMCQTNGVIQGASLRLSSVASSSSAHPGTVNLSGGIMTINGTTEICGQSFADNPLNTFTIGGNAVLNANGGLNMTSASKVDNYYQNGNLIQNGGTVNVIGGLNLVANNTTDVKEHLGQYDLNGGILNVDMITNLSSGTYASTCRGTFIFNGGTLKPTGSSTTFWANNARTTTSITNGGAIVDTAGFDITIAQPLVQAAGSTTANLTKLGAGTLTLAGTNTYTGTTTISTGILRTILTNSLSANSSVSIAAGGANLFLNFSGTNTVKALKLDNKTMASGVYGVGKKEPTYFSGNGALNVLTGSSGGTMVRFF